MNKLAGLLGLLTASVCAQTVSYTETVGTLPGELSITQGIASYQIPLELPDGRGGNTPQLAIEYSSQVDSHSSMGVGFTLSGLTSIGRCSSNQFTDQQYLPAENSPRDKFCLNGSRMVIADGIRGEDGSVYFLQQDNLTRISLTNNASDSGSYFVAKTKSGEQMTYRFHTQSGLWLLSETTNTTQTNPVKYTYTDNGDISRISYDIYQVDFKYQPMPNSDFLLSRKNKVGKLYSSSERLTRIELSASDTLKTYYKINYQPKGETQVSSIDGHLVRSVQYCDSSNQCLPATTFTWNNIQQPAADQEFFSQSTLNTQMGNWGKKTPAGWSGYPISWWTDVTGNGDFDFCKTASSGMNCHFNVAGENHEIAFTLTNWGSADSHWWLDLNGDNKNEYCRDDNQQLVCTTFSRDGSQKSDQYPLPDLGVKDYRWWQDMDGDGVTEFCRRVTTDLVCSQLEKQDSGFLWKDTLHLKNMTWEKGAQVSWVDLDGNGSQDLCRIATTGAMTCTLFNGTEVKGAQERHFSLTKAGASDKRWWVDINGDGASDLCRATKNSAGKEIDLTCSYGSLEQVTELNNDLVLEGGTDWAGTWGDTGKSWWQDFNQDGVIDFCRAIGTQVSCTNINHENYRFKITSWGDGKRWFFDLNQDSKLDFCTSQSGQLNCASASTPARQFLLSKVTNGLGMTSQVWFGSYGAHTDRTKLTPPELPMRSLSLASQVAYRLDADNGSGKTSYVFRYGPYTYHGAGERSGGFSWIMQREFINGKNSRNHYVELYTAFPYTQRTKHSQEYLANDDQLDATCSKCNEDSFWNYRHLTLTRESETAFGYKTQTRTGQAYQKSQLEVNTKVQSLASKPYQLIQYQNQYYVKKPEMHVPIAGSIIVPISPSPQYYLAENFAEISELSHGAKATLTAVSQDVAAQLALQPIQQEVTYIVDPVQYQQVLSNTPVTVSHETYLVYETTRTDKEYDLSKDLLRTIVTSNEQVDDYGNPAKSVTETTGINPVSGVSESYKTEVEKQYSNDNSAKWLIGLLTHVQTTHIHADGSKIVRSLVNEYDPDTGLLLKETKNPGNSLAVTKQYHYNDEGFPESETISAQQNGSQSSRTTASLQNFSQATLTESRTDPMGHQIRTVFDRVNNLTTIRDINNLESRIYKDSFGRKTEIWQPTTNGFVKTYISYLSASASQCGPVPSGAVYCKVSQTSGKPDEAVFYDLLDREIRKSHKALNGKWAIVDSQYNALNQVLSVTRAYYQGDVPQYTYNHYDKSGRLVSVSEPGPAGKDSSWVTYTYSPFVKVKTDANGRKHSTYTNVMGWQIQVSEAEGGKVSKHYYADGSLKQVTDSGGHTASFQYNIQGKKIYHKDPDLGTWTYVYDGFGQLQSVTDAKDQTSAMTYDALGRMIKRTEQTKQSGETTKNRTTIWAYDAVSDKNGTRRWNGALLQSEVKDELIENYYFDTAGRKIKEEQITEDQTFTRSFEYNTLGQLVKETRPDNFTLNYKRDNTTGINTEIWGDITQAQVNFSAEEYQQVILPLIDQALARAKDYLQKVKELRAQQYFYQARQEEYQALQDHVISVDGASENAKYAQKMYAELHGRALDVYTDEYGEEYYRVPDRTVIVNGSMMIPVIQSPQFHLKLEGNVLRQVSLEEWAAVESSLTSSDKVAYYGNYTPEGTSGLATFTLDRDDPLYDQRMRQMFTRLNTLASDIQRAQYVQDHINQKATTYLEAANQLVNLVKQVKLVSQKYRSLTTSSETEAEQLQALKDDNPSAGRLSYWKMSDMDAEGRITAEVYGNGLINSYDYHEGSGQLLNVSTRQGSKLIRSLQYTYDRMDNVTSRYDIVNDIYETYSYDKLDRLISNRLTGTNGKHMDNPLFNQTYTVKYSTGGNIVYKSDVGNYLYADASHAHAVTKAGDATYTYDNNGNMLSGNGRSFVWTGFNKPEKMTSADSWASFKYDQDRKRYFKQNNNGEKTWYFDKSYERVEGTDGKVTHKQYVYAGGRLIAVNIDVKKTDGDGNDASVDRQVRYSHSDALQSVDMVTDIWGNIVTRKNYDAWGKSRAFEWAKPSNYVAQALMMNRTYTGHEEVTEVGLIHMNGRVYDPILARFISADPYIQAPDNTQSYNRYSYVVNNPMKYSDPSGHFFKKLFKKARKLLKRIAKNVYREVSKSKWVNDTLRGFSCSVGMLGCLLYDGFMTLGKTGSFTKAGISMAASFITSVSVDIGVKVGKWVQELALKASPYLSKAVNATLSWTGMDKLVGLFTDKNVGNLASKAAVYGAYKGSSKFVTKELNKLADSMKKNANSTETGTIAHARSMIASAASITSSRGVSAQQSRSQSTAASARTNPLSVYDTTTSYQQDVQRAAAG
ncbi:tRNA(Glu)-specific nuclease WapA precursor [Vibrio aerogenes CECT 7868]|uniref:tRNA(Glu)-specific nuclease WapA n=1 Tax=Vibrio aerogenes CECT 7868 TaxID=1216006 RepID=A0A1M5UMI3_9VIBR|nr:RHS repeat-associated core domain-containing protein [Vibrio aerogenes]SHH64167.1 tRNA(Glu)-specific nuclease WapA precursor [Vibrio aerogenes CECT 7868]